MNARRVGILKDDVLACFAWFEAEAAKIYKLKPYPPESI